MVIPEKPLIAATVASAPKAAPEPAPAAHPAAAPTQTLATESIAHAAETLVPPARLVPKPPTMTAPIPIISRINLRRIPSAVDPLGSSAAGLEATLNPFRLAATSKVFGGLQQIQNHVGLILQTLQQTKLPPNLIGVLQQPDGSFAARVQVEFLPSSVGQTGPTVIVLTADDGGFTLPLPSGALAPQDGLTLTVHGANTNTTVTVPTAKISASGSVGTLGLSVTLTPLPVSILSALAALVPSTSSLPAASTSTSTGNTPQVTIGEPGSVCVQSFSKAPIVDKFPWGIFFRLVEPQMSIVSQTQAQPAEAGKSSWLPVYVTQNQPVALNANGASGSAPSSFVDRIPIDQPLSLDGFRDQVAGIDTTGNFTADETVPMAASLGLGYVLQMSQQWTFEGLGLGNLVYSLPLAPGEQQQVAVFERQDTSAVQESEFFTESEAMNQSALSDTSTNATFNSAFNEAASGGSQYQTNSSSSSWGVSGGFSLGFISAGGSGGGGSSSSNGTASNWLQGQRDATEQAAQSTHSSAENQASARVTASRTGMRLATASENMDVTTKIITNHNHTRALTMQYWEVHRIYDVTTAIDGLSLVCLVPMQIVRFMPPGQPATLSDPSTVSSHGLVLERYKNILRHLDVLQLAVPRSIRHGLTLLSQFASDPTTVVDSSGTVAEDVIGFKLQGRFLACETISVAAVTKRNTRVGPVKLASAVSGQPSQIPQNQFASQSDLVAWLTFERNNSLTTLQGSMALPTSLNRSDIIGFEITRQFDTVSCTLIPPAVQVINQLFGLFGVANPGWEQSSALLGPAANSVPQTVVLSAGTLENLIGGPEVSYFSAAIEDVNAGGDSSPAAPHETYANDNLFGTVLPPQPFPVPALQIAPVLRYKDILEIERTAQHIVRNTTRYSRALWMSMTAEERAILLDGYTIGVPPGGLTDASDMIPLLNCVQNKVLGTFGNSLVMPFIIPQEVAETMGIDPGQLQQALLSYQQEGFVPPHSVIALPTRGVLGEAVLGHCQSAEKIDLTRFWNWQDAPADTAPGIGMVQLPTTTPPLTTGVTAPNSLTNLPPLINNLIAPPQPNTSLLQAMGQQATSQPDFSPTLTGQQQLAGLMQNGQSLANSARSDALKTSQTLASQAMTTVSSLISSSMKQASSAAGGATGSTPGGATGGTPGGNQQASSKTATTKGTANKTSANQSTSSNAATGATKAAGSTGSSGTGGAAGAAPAAGSTDAAGAAGGAAGDAGLGAGAGDLVADGGEALLFA
jgi:hypothetical protein